MMIVDSKFFIQATVLLLPVIHCFQSSSSSRSTIITTTSSVRNSMEQESLSSPLTKLWMNSQKKKPRFTQQAHITKKKTTMIGKNKKKKIQPWETGKSIEELESNLVSRWGTLDDPSVSSPSSSSVKRKKSSSSSASSPADLRMPVFDPWEEDNKKSKSNIVREYYDEDDEGFEYVELDDDEYDEYYEIEDEDEEMIMSSTKNNNNNNNNNNSFKRMKVGHLISPKPVGGRGTRDLIDDDEPTGSYFFNPKSSSTTETTRRNEKQAKEGVPTGGEGRGQQEESKKKKPSSNNNNNAVPAAEPLLDEDGTPRLLTLEEALNQFQSTVDSDVMEVIESEETPIVAFSNSQSWQDLGITSEVLIENLEYMNCPSPLAVQEKCVPSAITGNDVLVGTYTGSGKTLAFLTPLVQRLLWNDSVEDLGLAILVIAPGRELASQIVSVTRELVQDTGLKVQLAIGGTTFSRNLEQIRKQKPNILVGTPGRIAELVVGKPGEKSGRLKIASLQALVMDEFDALLEYKPHRDPTRAIMQTLKRRHRDTLQSILCSATASDIMESSKVVDFLRPGFETAMADKDDVLVSQKNVKSTMVSRTAIHGVIHVQHRRYALDTIRRILHTEPTPQQILIFVENSRKVDIVVEKLGNMGIIAAALHGGMGSEKMDRAEVSKALREGYVGIVVATELAARGLDAPLLTHVINLDLPTDASHYAHRAGRCGRGGRPGVVINVTTSPKERNVPQRFADSLGIEMHSVEPRSGKLVLVDPKTQKLD